MKKTCSKTALDYKTGFPYAPFGMSVIPQQKYPLRFLQTRPRSCTMVRATCSKSVTPNSPPLLNDPSLQSTWTHRVWLACGCTAVLISLAKAVVGAASSHTFVGPLVAGYVGYLLADLGSGVYHWAIDNYGDASTPVFGAQIEGFQGHHKLPWRITKTQFAKNLHDLGRAITFAVLPIDLLCNDPTLHGFIAVFAGCILFSQQFHAWSHVAKSKLPLLVVWLQDAGVILSRSQHLAHHKPPYNNNYCIVSGVWNHFLDQHKIFEALEMLLFSKLRVVPRSWTEPNAEWTEETETASQKTVK